MTSKPINKAPCWFSSLALMASLSLKVKFRRFSKYKSSKKARIYSANPALSALEAEQQKEIDGERLLEQEIISGLISMYCKGRKEGQASVRYVRIGKVWLLISYKCN